MNKNWVPIIVVVLILAGMAAGLTSLARPRVLGAGGPAADFSAERAMEHVSAIAQAPHPTGSQEIDRVRAYIVAQLEEMGLAPEIQKASTAIPRGSAAIATTVENVIARVPGSDSSKAILLDAHFDTRAMTAGASDCSSCVAVVLETARALLAGPPLRNDVILVFTDNEEYGGAPGAAALVESNDWLDEVGLVLNFEGLGSTGPSILFETGPESRWAVQEWARQASLPVGQSWFQEIYGRTPISTDMNWYSDRGIPGLNFGFWAKGTAYHTMLDTPEALDPRSVQHQGTYALALVQHLGNRDLRAVPAKSGSAVYFSLVRGVLIRYSTVWAVLLAVVCGLLLLGLGVVGVRGIGGTGPQLAVRGMLKGLGAFVLSVVASSGLATGIWMGANQLHGEYRSMLTLRGMPYNAYWYLFAFVALAVAVAAAILVWLRKKTAVMDLVFGALLFWWLLALVTSIAFSGFSYLFTWPLLFCTLAMGYVLWRSDPDEHSWQTQLAWTLGALPGVILFVPGLYVMYHFALAPMIGVLAFMVSLLLGLLIPQLDLFTRARPWRFVGAAALVCLAFLVAGSLTARSTPERPRPNAVAYLLDADSGRATWFSAGPEQDDWTGQFFASNPERGTTGKLFPIAQRSGFPIWQGEAPKVALEAPQVDVLDDQTAGGVRKVQLNLRSPRGAPVMMLDVQPYGAIQAVTVEGKRIEPIESKRNLWSLTYYAVPEDGFQVALELDPSQAMDLQVSDQTWELVPEVLDSLGAPFQPRSEAMMPMPNFDYGTVVVKTLRMD